MGPFCQAAPSCCLKWAFWCLLKLEVMAGCSLIGCQEDSKYFHTHTAIIRIQTPTYTHTKHTHGRTTSWFNWSNRLSWPVVQNHKAPLPTQTQTSRHAQISYRCIVGAPNKDLSGSAEQWRKARLVASQTGRWIESIMTVRKKKKTGQITNSCWIILDSFFILLNF